jgi:hypothetical protein
MVKDKNFRSIGVVLKALTLEKITKAMSINRYKETPKDWTHFWGI